MIDGVPHTWKPLYAVIVACAVAATGGCAQRATHLRQARVAFLSGDLEVADHHLDKLIGKRDKKQEVLLADKAMISLLQGDVRSAEALLRHVRDGFEHLEQKDLTESTLSMLTDDRRRAYAGEDYEKILVGNFLAISNLLGDGDDALAYCLQANATQQRIIESQTKAITKVNANSGANSIEVDGNLAAPLPADNLSDTRVGLAAYLYGVIQEATHINYDEARRAYATVAQWTPTFRAAAFDLHRVQTASHSAKGHGVIYVIGLVGPGPVKEEVVAPVTSQSLAIAGHILNALGDQTSLPISAPVKIPQVVLLPTRVGGVLLQVDGNTVGVTETATDVGQLAISGCLADRDHTIARAIVRRIVKKGAIYKAKDELADNTWTSLALDASGFLWEAVEAADTRCWSTLPGTIQILRCEVPAGTHEISLAPVAGNQVLGNAHACDVNVADGRNTYVLASFPDTELSGRIVVSKHASNFSK